MPSVYYEFHPELIRRARVAESKGMKLVCRLWRPLYGTKQGGAKWYEELDEQLTKVGFRRSDADYALYIYQDTEKKHWCLLTVSTDDCTFVSDSKATTKKLRDALNDHMELVDLGNIHWLLGVGITRNENTHTISLSQSAYIDQLIERFGLQDAHPVATPLEPGTDLTPGSPGVSETKLSPKFKTLYMEIWGCLMYLAVMTRPDIAYTVNQLGQLAVSTSKNLVLLILTPLVALFVTSRPPRISNSSLEVPNSS